MSSQGKSLVTVELGVESESEVVGRQRCAENAPAARGV